MTLNKPIPTEVADKLFPKLKELRDYFNNHTFVTEEGQLKPIIYSEASTWIDCDEEVYICPHCGDTHLSECCVSHATLYPRLHCDNCNKVSRAEPTTLIDLDEIPDIFYDIAAENIHYLIDEFLRINQDFQALYIEGRNLNWRGSSGFATSTLSRKDLLDKITIGNDYHLTIKHNQRDNTLEVRCAHHDATSYMTVTPTYTCCISGEVIAPEDLQDAKDSANILNTFEGAEFYDHIRPLELEYRLHSYLETPLADLASDLAKSKQLTVSRAKLLKEAQEQIN